MSEASCFHLDDLPCFASIFFYIRSHINYFFLSRVKGDSNLRGKPECLVRIENLTGRAIIFYEADLQDKRALKEIFAKVTAVDDRLLRILNNVVILHQLLILRFIFIVLFFSIIER